MSMGDLLQMATKDNSISGWMKLSEIKNGRLAMLAISAYAFLEFFQQKPIIETINFLFQQLDDTIDAMKAINNIP